jgi:hypothetical protein
MVWSIDVNEAKRLVTVSVQGQWEAMGVLDALDALWAAQVRTGILGALWDMRGVVGGGVSTYRTPGQQWWYLGIWSSAWHGCSRLSWLKAR